MRVFKTPYVAEWEDKRQNEIAQLTSQGILPHEHNVKKLEQGGTEVTPEMMINFQPMLMGQVAGNIEDVKSAQEIVDDMISGAKAAIKDVASKINARL